MQTLTLDGPGGRLRARRWDVVVLGSALPGLVASVRLGMAGLRVLVVEEETAARIPPLLREPFFLAGAEPDSLLQKTLVALGIPLIDRRAVETREVAYQLLLPDARIDVGLPARAQEELVAWGLAKPEVAHEAVRGLESAAEAEAEVLLRTGVVRRGARPTPSGPGAPAGRHMRGLPAVLRQAEPAFAELLDAQLKALSLLGSGEPSPEARARLLGAPLSGGASFPAGKGLTAQVRRRIEQLHGEFRRVGGPFELAEIDGDPAVVLRRSRDAWLGRALVLNAPEGRLAAYLSDCDAAVPPFLDRALPTRRRAALQMRALREVLPEALAERAIRIDADPAVAPLCLAVLPSDRGVRYAEITASRAVDEGADLAETHDRIESDVRALLPFSGKKVARLGVAERPAWDDELGLADLAAGGWPTDVDIRAGARALVYRLGRAELGGLGSEGDLLLGWQAGDTLTASLR